MEKVLTCFVMGRSLDGFTIVVAEAISIDNAWIPVKDFTVGLLKKHIWKEISYDFDGSGIGPNRLNLWKAEIPVSEENRKILENPEIEYIKQTFSLEKLEPGNMFLDNEVFPKEYEPPQRHFHIIVQLPPATTGTTGGSIPVKRQAEPQVYNREPVAPREREFWNELAKAQIVLKLPDDADKTIYMSEPLSKYMKVEGNKIVLGDNVMLNSEDELIFCDGNPVIESG